MIVAAAAAANQVIQEESETVWGRVAAATAGLATAVTTTGLSGPVASEETGSLEIVGQGFSASERRAATYMAQQGNRVLLREAASDAGRTSDLVVNGMRYDVMTPTTSNVGRIISAMAKKNSQAQGIVLDLSRTPVRPDQLPNALSRVQGAIRAGGKPFNIVDVVGIK